MIDQPRDPAGTGRYHYKTTPRPSGALGAAPEAWPAVGYEEDTWAAGPRAAFGVQAARFDRGASSYRSAIPAPIAELTPRLPGSVSSDADDAVIELARFDAELGSEVSAFAPVLLRSEAASSSQIEHLTASARAILTAEYGQTGSQNATLIAANTAALSAAVELADDATPDAIRHVHRVLMTGQPRHTPGEWRTEPVWIGSSGSSPVGAHYVAPRHERIPGLIDDLSQFTARRDIQPLAHVAIAHAQFETIHPFTDGNGRTGRALAQALLRHRGVTRNVAVPVSAGLLAATEDYHAALDAYRHGDPAPIVSKFAEASLRASVNARQLVGEIRAVRERWKEDAGVRRGSQADALLGIISRRPVITAKEVARELGIRPQNAYPLLARLEEAGILKKKAEHRIDVLWRSDEILAAIDAFASRAGRRDWG